MAAGGMINNNPSIGGAGAAGPPELEYKYGFKLTKKRFVKSTWSVSSSQRKNSKTRNSRDAFAKNGQEDENNNFSSQAAGGNNSYNIFIFLCDTKADYLAWEQALQSYVIQSMCVTDAYDIKDKLG